MPERVFHGCVLILAAAAFVLVLAIVVSTIITGVTP